MSTSEIEPSPSRFEFGHGPSYSPGKLNSHALMAHCSKTISCEDNP
ncbi:hypothetical protein [Methanobrevibacter sp.]